MRESDGSMFLLPALALLLVPGCVTEQVPFEAPRGPALFSFHVTNPSRLMEAGSYHGTNLFFEIDVRKDLSFDGMISSGEVPLQLPFITPKIDRQREIYEVGELHTVVLSSSRWEVGQQRYALHDRSRLYVFKEVPGDFRFTFRGQEIVVESRRSWIPSVYYYFEEEPLEPGTSGREGGGTSARQRRRISREVVQVGASTIELYPGRSDWRVNGRPFDFDPAAPLVLRGSVRAAPPAAD